MTQFGLFITELLYVFERLGMQHTSYMDNFYNISMVFCYFLSLKVSVSYQWNLIFKKLSVLKVILYFVFHIRKSYRFSTMRRWVKMTEFLD